MREEWSHSNISDKSDRSDSSDRSDRLIPLHGGYRRLRSFQVASQIYDATVIFCERFVPRSSRTRDQMIQAARSGRQNIAEGSVASATSKKTEIKLTNVARASLEELLLDYEDFLRHRGLRMWPKDSTEARRVRGGYGVTERSDPYHLAEASPEIAANSLVCLVNQAIYLLRRQIERLERDFLSNGGFTENLYRKRVEARGVAEEGCRGEAKPACPQCSRPMQLRAARKGPKAGERFWGCSAYPACTGTRRWRPSDESDKSDRSDQSD